MKEIDRIENRKKKQYRTEHGRTALTGGREHPCTTFYVCSCIGSDTYPFMRQKTTYGERNRKGKLMKRMASNMLYSIPLFVLTLILLFGRF